MLKEVYCLMEPLAQQLTMYMHTVKQTLKEHHMQHLICSCFDPKMPSCISGADVSKYYTTQSNLTHFSTYKTLFVRRYSNSQVAVT